MSNMPNAAEPNKNDRSNSILFVVVLLMVVAGIVAFISLHSSGAQQVASPATTAAPAPEV